MREGPSRRAVLGGAAAGLAMCDDGFIYQSGASVLVDGGALAGRKMVLPPVPQ